MKSFYTYGEMILALREEYKECGRLLNKLNTCIDIKDDYDNYYFKGIIPSFNLNDRKICLVVKKWYPNFLNKIQKIKDGIFGGGLYIASYDVLGKEDGLYELKYKNIDVEDGDCIKYVPEINITDKYMFSKIINDLFSTDLMQLKEKVFSNNNEDIVLGFGSALITIRMGDYWQHLSWNGIDDTVSYLASRRFIPKLYDIENILSLEMPAYKISTDWGRIFEKYESNPDVIFNYSLDKGINLRKDCLQFSDEIQGSEYCKNVRLLKK